MTKREEDFNPGIVIQCPSITVRGVMALLIPALLILYPFFSLEFVGISRAGGETSYFPGYMDSRGIEQELKDLERMHPDILDLQEIGNSWENRPIWAVKISDNPAINESQEPDILFFGGVHARELISVRVAMDLIKMLASQYENNSSVSRTVDSTETWIVPLVNPDGYDFVLSGHDWRKNRHPIDLNSDGDVLDPGEGIGVDLNRNWGHRWGEGAGYAGSAQPSSENYIGDSPFSEPEIRALRNLVLTRDFVFSVSYQSYGGLITYPWGNDVDEGRSSLSVLENVSRQLARRTGYTSLQGEELGATFGDSDDWLLAEGDVLPFTMELGHSHAPLREEEIHSISSDQMQAALYLMEIADKPERAQTADWNWLVYMAADSSLHEQGLKDINWMETVGSSQDVNIIVLFDGRDNGDSRIYHIQEDELGYNYEIRSPILNDNHTVIPQSGEVDMSEPSTLKRFLEWSINRYPSHHVLLSIWGHGSGVIGGNAYDAGLGYLTLPELRTVLEEVRMSHPNFIVDVLGLDVCNLGGIEAGEELASVANYLVASEDLEPSEGWPEHISMRKLVSNPLLSPEDLSRTIVRDYLLFHEFNVYHTLAAVDLYKFQWSVSPAWNDFSLALKTYFYHYRDSIRSHQMSSRLYGVTESDIGDFAKRVASDSNLSTHLVESARHFWEEYQESILEEGHGYFNPSATGLSVYFPETTVHPFYETEMRAGFTPWVEFLRLYTDPHPTPLIEINEADNSYTLETLPRINGYLLIPEEHDGIRNISLTLCYRVNQGELREYPIPLDNRPVINESPPDGLNIYPFSVDFPPIESNAVVQYFLKVVDDFGNAIRSPYNADISTWKSMYNFVTPLVDLEVDAFVLENGKLQNTYNEGENLNFSVVISNAGEMVWAGELEFILRGHANNSGEKSHVTREILKNHQISLEPNQEKRYYLNWITREGNWTISAQVSPDGGIMDINESDNRQDINIIIISLKSSDLEGNETDEDTILITIALLLVGIWLLAFIMAIGKIRKRYALLRQPHLVRVGQTISTEDKELVEWKSKAISEGILKPGMPYLGNSEQYQQLKGIGMNDELY